MKPARLRASSPRARHETGAEMAARAESAGARTAALLSDRYVALSWGQLAWEHARTQHTRPSAEQYGHTSMLTNIAFLRLAAEASWPRWPFACCKSTMLDTSPSRDLDLCCLRYSSVLCPCMFSAKHVARPQKHIITPASCARVYMVRECCGQCEDKLLSCNASHVSCTVHFVRALWHTQSATSLMQAMQMHTRPGMGIESVKYESEHKHRAQWRGAFRVPDNPLASCKPNLQARTMSLTKPCVTRASALEPCQQMPCE